MANYQHFGQHGPESPSLNGGSSISTQTMWACIAALGVKPYKDGNMWCFLYGDNIQEGIFGSGRTIRQAAVDFYLEVMRSPAIIDDSTAEEEEGKKKVAGVHRFKVGDVVRIDDGNLEYKIIKSERNIYTVECLWADAPYHILDEIYANQLTFVRSSSKKR